MSWTRPLSHRLFAGWFRPVGAAALFYACEARDVTGIAGTHLSIFLGRSRQRGNTP